MGSGVMRIGIVGLGSAARQMVPSMLAYRLILGPQIRVLTAVSRLQLGTRLLVPLRSHVPARLITD